MTGDKVPVVEIENLKLRPAGRGLNLYDDATNVDIQTWTGTSGGAITTAKYLPAASAQAWLRVTIGGTAYYFPGFNLYW